MATLEAIMAWKLGGCTWLALGFVLKKEENNCMPKIPKRIEEKNQSSFFG